MRDQYPAIIACILWATAFVFIKITIGYMSPLNVGGLRFIVAGLMLIPVTKGIAPQINLLKNNLRLVILVTLFQTTILYGIFFIALEYVRGAQASIIIGSSPLVNAVIAHYMMGNDDRLNKNTLISICFGLVGIILIVLASKPWEPVGFKEFIGMLCLMFGSIIAAFTNIVVAKQKHNRADPIALNSVQMFLGGISLSILAFTFEGIPSLNQPVEFWLSLIWLAFISACAFSIWFHMLSKVKVSKLNIWKFIIPVFGSIFAWIALPEESPDIPSLIGMLLVGVGIVVSVKQKKTIN